MATPTNLPASFVSGAILTAAQMNDLRGAFRVLQVVAATTSTITQNNTSTFADTTLTATITPQATTSKILVMVSQNGVYKTVGNSQTGVEIQLLRGATVISSLCKNAAYNNTDSRNDVGSVSTYVLDSPATLSATTYKTQFRNNQNATGVLVQEAGETSSIVLCEISA
jgi:hypothetical protein